MIEIDLNVGSCTGFKSARVLNIGNRERSTSLLDRQPLFLGGFFYKHDFVELRKR